MNTNTTANNKGSENTNTTDMNKHNKREGVVFPPGTAVYCINLQHRSDKWASIQRHVQRYMPTLQRWEAVNGIQFVTDKESILLPTNNIVQPQWDTTRNAVYDTNVTTGIQQTMTAGEMGCAASHVQLWQHLVQSDESTFPTTDATTTNKHHKMTQMLIVEDDIAITDPNTFGRDLQQVFQSVPKNWGILYLGFSSRGPRTYIVEQQSSEKNKGGRKDNNKDTNDEEEDGIAIYRPAYGFHTHAYMITCTAAQTLLQHLPVCGPLDVWLADHNWFGIPTYCCVATTTSPNKKHRRKGWYDPLQDCYEGVNFIRQQKRQLSSDVPTSSSSITIQMKNRDM
jgi:GR25 family glycosyltransferase involved in LPS biosynthesis